MNDILAGNWWLIASGFLVALVAVLAIWRFNSSGSAADDAFATSAAAPDVRSAPAPAATPPAAAKSMPATSPAADPVTYPVTTIGIPPGTVNAVPASPSAAAGPLTYPITTVGIPRGGV